MLKEVGVSFGRYKTEGKDGRREEIGEAIKLVCDWDPWIQRSLSVDRSRASFTAGVVVRIRLSPLLEYQFIKQLSEVYES
jgi:hypothetical protein